MRLLDLKIEWIKWVFTRSLRNKSLIFVVLSLIFGFLTPTLAQDVVELYKRKDYKAALALIQSQKEKTYKDYALQALIQDKLGDWDEKIKTLKKAAQAFPEKDILKRELSKTLEKRAKSYPEGNQIFAKLKTKLLNEAAQTLLELYKKNPSPTNFTALLNYYDRGEDYDETLALLELYAREHKKGKIYYSYLCRVHFKSKLYRDALRSCGYTAEHYPKEVESNFFYAKSLEETGKQQDAEARYVEMATRFPASQNFQLDAAKTLLKEGKVKEGLEHLEQHIQLGEPEDEALHLKAQHLFDLQNFDEALEAYIALCKQKEEPRKPLVKEFERQAKVIQDLQLRKKYQLEAGRCKYDYRPKRKAPRGYVNQTRSR